MYLFASLLSLSLSHCDIQSKKIISNIFMFSYFNFHRACFFSLSEIERARFFSVPFYNRPRLISVNCFIVISSLSLFVNWIDKNGDNCWIIWFLSNSFELLAIFVTFMLIFHHGNKEKYLKLSGRGGNGSTLDTINLKFIKDEWSLRC